jgi:hypothetical protein
MTQLKITTREIDNEVIIFDGGNNNNHPIRHKYDNAEDGKGLRERVDDGGNPTTMVVTSSAGRPLVVWGIEC